MNIFEELVNEFLDRTAHAHGLLARPNDTHFSHALVTQAIQHLRMKLLSGERLTEGGERFVASAAAFLGYLASKTFAARNLAISFRASFEPVGSENVLAVFAARGSGSDQQVYLHDFLLDMHNTVLKPARAFPCLHDCSYVLTSLTLPSVEYLYMLGVHFMSSPLAGGNWPNHGSNCGTDEEFALARELLVDDLLLDIGLPPADPVLRSLSNWVVWPPYGWGRNEGQAYNMMTLVDQIAVKKSVGAADGLRFLRALLRSQMFHLRNLAARTLVVLGEPPADPMESRFYHQAFNASDFSTAEPAMLRFAAAVSGSAPADPGAANAFTENTRESWAALLRGASCDPWFELPIFCDPDYQRFGSLDPANTAERLQCARELTARYPGDWFAGVAYADVLLQGADPQQGEQLMRQAAAATPGEPTAHFSLGGYYSSTGDDAKADAVFRETVQRWPWNPQAVANAMWALTSTMSVPPSEAQHGAPPTS